MKCSLKLSEKLEHSMLRGNEEHNCSDVSGSSTSADHRTEVVPDMLRYSKAFELSVEKLRQAEIKFSSTREHTSCRILHLLQLVSDDLRRHCENCIAVVNVGRYNHAHDCCSSAALSECRIHRSWQR